MTEISRNDCLASELETSVGARERPLDGAVGVREDDGLDRGVGSGTEQIPAGDELKEGVEVSQLIG